jgi:hypothetical protein
MEQKEIKPKRHLYLHKPPPDKRYAEMVGGVSFLIFLVIVVIRILAGLIK